MDLQRFLLILFLITCTMTASAQDYTQTQDKVKLLYVYNFLKNIEWKEYLEPQKVSICVLGRDELFEEFKKITSRQVNGRSISVIQVSSLGSCSQCDLIFLEEKSKTVLKREPTCNSLIITDGFYQSNLSNLVLLFKDEKLQFSINQELCDKHEYKITTHLIGLSNRQLLQ